MMSHDECVDEVTNRERFCVYTQSECARLKDILQVSFAWSAHQNARTKVEMKIIELYHRYVTECLNDTSYEKSRTEQNRLKRLQDELEERLACDYEDRRTTRIFFHKANKDVVNEDKEAMKIFSKTVRKMLCENSA
jgi:hypothetical protein